MSKMCQNLQIISAVEKRTHVSGHRLAVVLDLARGEQFDGRARRPARTERGRNRSALRRRRDRIFLIDLRRVQFCRVDRIARPAAQDRHCQNRQRDYRAALIHSFAPICRA